MESEDGKENCFGAGGILITKFLISEIEKDIYN